MICKNNLFKNLLFSFKYNKLPNSPSNVNSILRPLSKLNNNASQINMKINVHYNYISEKY